MPKAWPRFAYGFTVRWTTDFRNVTLLAPDGSIRWTTALSLPGVDQLTIRDAAICPGGRVVLATGLMAKDRAIVAAHVRLNEQGGIESVVRTHPYASLLLTCTPSGALWSVGRAMDSEFRDLPDYLVVRRFDPTGKEESATLPRTEAGPAERRHPADRAYLLADEDSYVLVSPLSLKLFQGKRGHYTVRISPLYLPTGCGTVAGAALMQSRIVLNCENNAPAGGQTDASEFSLAVLDRDSGVATKSSQSLPPRTILVGSDSGSMVFYGGNPRRLVKTALDQ